MNTPAPEAIRAARDAADLTQAEAAELVHLGSAKRWSEYECGAQAMDAARWELFLIKTGQHNEFALAQCSGEDLVVIRNGTVRLAVIDGVCTYENGPGIPVK